MIIFDPGHGGSDPGAVGPAGTREADINMIISRKQHIIFTARGIDSKLTHQGEGREPGANPNAELNVRSRYIHQLHPEIVISNHCNASTDRRAGGMEIFYYPGSAAGESLAGCVYPILLGVCQRYGIAGRGIKTANFAMTREPTKAGAAGILIEYAFISNPAEERILKSAVFQDQAAAAVVEGVLRFMGKDTQQPTEWEQQQQTASAWVRAAGISDGTRVKDPITRGELFVILKALADQGKIR